MLAPEASATDYLWAFQRLLPRGRVWQRGWGTLQAEGLLTLMPTWARLHGRANDVLAAIFPCSTVELLPEWEATLGLPDPCAGALDTTQARTAAVCAKFVARGGSSREYFIHLAAALGYQIVIETYKPFRVEQSSVGDPLCDESWVFAWRIIVESTSTIYIEFRVETSAVGEPLRTWGIRLLECAIDNSKPANTVPIWSYQVDAAIWDDGASIWDVGDSIWDRGLVSP